MSVTERPMLPVDVDSAPYWEAIDAGELRIQQCADCGVYRWPARAMCNRCFGFEHRWPRVGGAGEVVSWIRTHRAFLPHFADDLPYATVAIRLAEQDDLILVGQLAGEADPVIGARVRAVIRGAGGGRKLVFWEGE